MPIEDELSPSNSIGRHSFIELNLMQFIWNSREPKLIKQRDGQEVSKSLYIRTELTETFEQRFTCLDELLVEN